MPHTRIVLFALTGLAVMTGSGLAQPSSTAPTRFAQPPPPPPESIEQAEPAPSPSRWSIGLSLSGGELTNADDPSNDAEVEGYEVFARYKLTPRFEVEVSLGKFDATMQGDRLRELRPVSVSLLLHLFERGQLSGYVRGGMGKAKETYTTSRSTVELEDSTAHLGAGLQYRLQSQKFSFAAELRGSKTARIDDSLPMDGTQFGVAAMYHF